MREQQLDLAVLAAGRQKPDSTAAGRTRSPVSESRIQARLSHLRKPRPSWVTSISWPKCADSIVG